LDFHTYKVKIDNSATKYRNVLRSDNCEVPDDVVGCKQKASLLEIINTQHDLFCPGGKSFQTLHMYHDGISWRIDTESVVTK
jgi:hypothetical protein